MEHAPPQAPVIVFVVLSNMTRVMEVRGEGLSDEAKDAIREIGLGWRNPSDAVRRLQEAQRVHGTPPLAIWYVSQKHIPEAPQPVEVPFEPLELDEGRSPLDELVPGRKDDETRRAHAFRRGLLRVGMPMAAILPQVINGGIQMAVNPTRFIILLWAAIWGVLALVLLLLWWSADDWYIVPGGVVLRRSIWRRVGQKIAVYQPKDTTLIIRMHPPGYAIEVWRDGKGRQRRVTELEVLAALGAWQSKQPAPSIEQLSDLLSSSET